MRCLHGRLWIHFLSVVAVLSVAVTIARAHDPITTRVTWTGEIARIVQARCVTCHSAGGKAPMPLASFEDARPWARAIKEEVLTRRMPKWHAARGYGDFANDPSLSAFELALIAAWVDGGAPERPRPERSPGVPVGVKPGAAGPPSESERGWAASAKAPANTRELVLACRNQLLPQGQLLAVRPELQKSDDLGLAVQRQDGRREIVAWIRNYDPDFPTTYWLRTPIVVANGAQLLADGRADCRVTVTMTGRTPR